MGAGDRSGYQTLLRLLNEEMCLTVFPEGSRTKDGRLLPLQAGVGRAAVATGARVVPVSLLGLSQCWPRGQTLPRLFRPIVIKFHPPLGGEKIGDKGLAREAAAQLTASLERRLNRSLGAWNRIRNRPNKRH
ncbi:MAG: 1-acyl-sn-glycerol-3-phosphate acyltransferase, partial [Gammaproteobacteria bacterium]|nr:1-acyl-sn-glycerol-3-phosphate acyltransferase [Gammaproteobacteria bacterium]